MSTYAQLCIGDFLSKTLEHALTAAFDQAERHESAPPLAAPAARPILRAEADQLGVVLWTDKLEHTDIFPTQPQFFCGFCEFPISADCKRCPLCGAELEDAPF